MHQALLIYLTVGGAAFLFPGVGGKRRALVPALLLAGFFLFFLFKLPFIAETGAWHQVILWIPELGLNLEFLLDGLSLFMVILVAGIGALVFLYSRVYMKEYQETGRFYLYLFLFAGSMTGLVLSANLIQLFIFWELTSVLSFLLIGFFHEKAEARRAAFQSLYITGFGGLCMLAGIILLGSIPGSYSLPAWLASSAAIRASSFYVPGLLLILVGAFTKSAQFPFHFWLPTAMKAPAPVSAYLHSATMVKAGFFLLARLAPVLGGTPEWKYIISSVGVLTMLVGSYLAISQKDIKSILAYTTINGLGILVLLIGINTEQSASAALIFLFVHAMYKATLFMMAGMIEKKTGTRDIDRLGGLARHMPVSFIIALLAALSMAGLPPMLGFLGKELIYEAKVELPGINFPLLVLGVLSNILMVAVSLAFLYKIFLGPPRRYAVAPDEKGWLLLAGPAVLALFSLVLGLFPDLIGNTLINTALPVMHAGAGEVDLKIWHGVNTVFFLSLLTVFFGLLLSWLIIRKTTLLEAWRRMNNAIFYIRFSELFSAAIDRFIAFSGRKEKVMQHGYHRYYILTIVSFTALLMWGKVILGGVEWPEMHVRVESFFIPVLVGVMVPAVLYSTLTRSRMAAIIDMGVVGYGISLIYMYFSAVDLAIMQILVETLTVVIFVLVLQRLPRFAILSTRRTRIRDLTVALVFGSVMTMVALFAVQANVPKPVSEYFQDRSLTDAFGRNVVNVILVDFRAFDTLGETVVLITAALGILVLIGKKTGKI
ncbi:MAG TPA: DUF4040 domain-containing protein [Bacteroidetes bacterium]|nr:DUF4040 domain-containing protein [Bacteroidota bacterium]